MERIMATKTRKKVKISAFDAANYLKTDADCLAYLQACIDEAGDDPSVIAGALGAIARARGGMSKVARSAGLTREGLYKALAKDGNPSLGTVLKVSRALGVRLVAEAA
jgi:probable addiction module antidote protein